VLITYLIGLLGIWRMGSSIAASRGVLHHQVVMPPLVTLACDDLGMVRGLHSAKAKLAWAVRHLKALKRSVARYSASRPYKIVVTKAKGKVTKKLLITEAPPVEISILAGEMVYQMRSALDHLAFDLVERNPSKLARGGTGR
jgi:hypothetical protein